MWYRRGEFTAGLMFRTIAQTQSDSDNELLTWRDAKRNILGDRAESTTPGSSDMKGSIVTENRCHAVVDEATGAKCGKEFTFVPGLGFHCETHTSTYPLRFIVKIYYASHPGAGEKVRIYCDRTGLPLDSFFRAKEVLEAVNKEIEAGSFRIENWQKKARTKWMCSNLLPTFLKEKTGYDLNDPVKNKEGQEVAPSFVDDYIHHVKLHLEYWRSWDVRDIMDSDVNVGYLNWLKERPEYAGKNHLKTVKNVFEHFRVFHNWCIEKQLIQPGAKILFEKIMPPKPRLTKPLTEQQVYNLFHKHTPEQHKPIVAFLSLHPCRPGEARALTVGKVNLKRASISIDCTFSDEILHDVRKNEDSKPYAMPIHPSMYPYIAWRKSTAASEDEWLFPDPSGHHYTQSTLAKMFAKIRASANLPKNLRLYDATRHTVASILADKGHDVFEIQKLLGHSNASTTQRYTTGAVVGTRINSNLTLLAPPAPGPEDEDAWGSDGAVAPPLLSET